MKMTITEIPIETPVDWNDYELIDSGQYEKLERFGSYVVSRPDPRAIWTKLNGSAWEKAHARHNRIDPQNGHWTIATPPPNSWRVTYHDVVFTLRPTEFKHVGVFPEQAVNWQFMKTRIRPGLKVLNLFAYTGGSTLFAAKFGAQVTHVDSAKSAIAWARENAAASKLDALPIRWIEEDVMKFVAREIRRGNTYDAIIMDPPRFGRGSKGEVWKIEDDLSKLMALCTQLLSPNPQFILLNAYTADLSPIALFNILATTMKDKNGTTSVSELALQESVQKRLLPSGIVARWTKTA